MNELEQLRKELPIDPAKVELIKGRCAESGDCWIWLGPCHGRRVKTPYIERTSGRRTMWRAMYGEPEKSLRLVVSCGNEKCLNPAHLELWTNSDVVRDSFLKKEKVEWSCKKCGSDKKYGNGDCKNCADLRSKKYSATHKAVIKEKKAAYWAENSEIFKKKSAAYYRENAKKLSRANKIYREKNKEKCLARNIAWAAKNPEKVKSYKDKWEAANPERRRITTHNYRGRKRSTGGRISPGLAKTLFVLQKGKCACCSKPLGDDYHLDHIMPLALGGSNTDDNIQLLRKACNLQKQAKHPVDFMQQRGFLL